MARTKKRKSRAPRRPPATGTLPLWLAELQADIFDSSFPKVDPAYLLPASGETVVCERRLEHRGGRIFFHEIWRHPHSLEPRHAWAREMDFASYLTPEASVRTNAIAILRRTARAGAVLTRRAASRNASGAGWP
jgi:hypothetical protein